MLGIQQLAQAFSKSHQSDVNRTEQGAGNATLPD
jgi:hypothetical protein